MKGIVKITKALADENRLRALAALNGRELCVCQIIALLGLAPSTVSKHMSILRHADLVESRKEGRWMHYRLPVKGEASCEVHAALQWVCDSLKGARRVQDDAVKLKKILQMEPEDLCQKQKCG